MGQSSTSNGVDRRRKARKIIDEYLRDRPAGEPLDAQELIEAHETLRPELEQELKKLEIIGWARLDASMSARPTVPPSSFFPGYDLVEEMCRGGQGVVYRAVQKGTNREVAIKVMREGPFAGKRDRSRFEREARLLAQLDHPNIVPVLDMGSTSGTTYFVMPYVRGQSLEHFVVEGDLTIDETLRLFARVCDAVNVAHLRGVIHRDLKPGNVRVDPGGSPHVLDFGLAKVSEFDPLAERRSEVATVSGQFVGSLPWASPEQARGEVDIDVRSDVYSLGVILYQLLTGRFPYEVRNGVREVIDAIATAEPLKPRRHGTELNDEVETIVLKCLHKDRDRRYQSAGNLSRDIHRYLTGEPIEARRDSSWYVFHKMLRKHRLPVAAATIAVVVLVGVTVAMSVLAHRTARAEQAATAEARSALAAFEGLRELFYKGQSGEITERELLEVSAHEAVTRLDGQPRAQARLMEAIASICEGRAFWDLEAEWRARIVELHRTVIDSADHEVAAALQELGRACQQAKRHDESIARLTESLEIRRRLHGDRHLDVATTARWLAHAYFERGEADRAVRLYRDAVAVHRSLAPGDAVTARCLIEYGSALDNLGRYDEAESVSREALALARRIEPESELTASALNAVSIVLMSESRFDESLKHAEESLDMLRRLLPEGHLRMAASLYHVGLLHKDMGQYTEAEDRILEALEIRRRYRGPAGEGVAYGQHCLAKVYMDAGDLARALDACQRALELHVEAWSPDHRNVARPMTDLGLILVRLGRHREAERHLRRALQIREDTKPPGHWKTAKTRSILGAALAGQCRYQEAEPHLTESYPIIAADRGPQHRRTREALERVIDLYDAWGKPEKAAEWRAKLLPSD